MPQYCFDELQQILTGPDGAEIKLRPQSLQVLKILLQNADYVVSRDTITREVWGNLNVTDDSVTQCVADIRRAIGEEHRCLLQTVPKKGYRMSLGESGGGDSVIKPIGNSQPATHVTESSALNGPLLTNDSGKSTDAQENNHTQRTSKPLGVTIALMIMMASIVSYFVWDSLNSSTGRGISPASRKGPTMAVLPFTNTSISQDNQYFSDGVTEDVIAALTRFSGLHVMSWNAVSQYKSGQTSIEQISNEFGIRYLITGSVRHDDGRIRISVQLSDLTNGQLLWTERYDEPLKDVFLVQDKISKQVATALSVKLTDIEMQRAHLKPTENMAAYELVLAGRSLLRQRSRENNFLARDLFEQAISIDPEISSAYRELGETYVEETALGWTEWPMQSLDKAFELAKRAIELDSQDSAARVFLSMVYFRKLQFDLAQAELDRAFKLNPNDPKLHATQGMIHSRTERFDAAIASFEYARQYDPDIHPGWTELGAAYFMSGKNEKAIQTLQRGLALNPDIIYARTMLTAALVEADSMEDAKLSADEVKRLHPFFDSARFSNLSLFNQEKDQHRIMTLLQRAGLP